MMYIGLINCQKNCSNSSINFSLLNTVSYLGGLFSRKSWTCAIEGLNRESCSQGILKRNRTTHCPSNEHIIRSNTQFYAHLNKCLSKAYHLAVHSATAFPAPQNSASSSMPSSRHTVLSTSKHTASASRHTSRTSYKFKGCIN